MKFIGYTWFLLVLVSCDNINLSKVEENSSSIVAIVNTSKLFTKDIAQILPYFYQIKGILAREYCPQLFKLFSGAA